MNAMTAENLRSAYGGESQAHMRYKVWGMKALEEGFVNVARLFSAGHFKVLKDIKGYFSVT